MKLKICGIRSDHDIRIINKYQPDFMGFIFYPKSFRYVSPKLAQNLKRKLNKNIKAVGVFVNENKDYIKELYDKKTFDLIQLHGDETQKEIDFFKKNKIPVIKAVRIKNKDELDNLNLSPDYFLFDTFSQKVVGGSGKTFSWDTLKTYKLDIPFFLAGGINIKNLKEALKTNAFALDISSGVETNKVKDIDKIKQVVEEIGKI